MLWVWGESRGSPKAKEIKEWKQATRTKTEKEKKKQTEPMRGHRVSDIEPKYPLYSYYDD